MAPAAAPAPALPGAQSETDPLRTVLVKHARDAWPDDAAIDREWRALGYPARPDLARAHAESDRFIALLQSLGADVRLVRHEHPDVDSAFPIPHSALTLDSLYVRDAAVACERGVILCSMGKPARRAEPAALERALAAEHIPVHGHITGDGRLEGGDVVWLAPRTVAVGRGYRTNDDGIAQLARALSGLIDELMVVPLPHWRGPDDVFHLMSIVSPLDRDLALVYEPLLPVPFRERLLALGLALVAVPDGELATLGGNVLAVGPRRVVMVSGNPDTRRRLERAGCEVHECDGGEICLKGGGGPTCLTRPLTRGAPPVAAGGPGR
jgi:N-dimethylarginine dimethylaminohydrolase